MQYMTVPEYAELCGVTRQAIWDRIKRGTLRLVPRKRTMMLVPVPDTELKKVKVKDLAHDKV